MNPTLHDFLLPARPRPDGTWVYGHAPHEQILQDYEQLLPLLSAMPEGHADLAFSPLSIRAWEVEHSKGWVKLWAFTHGSKRKLLIDTTHTALVAADAAQQRPAVRAWLHENMPKIVEKALLSEVQDETPQKPRK